MTGYDVSHDLDIDELSRSPYHKTMLVCSSGIPNQVGDPNLHGVYGEVHPESTGQSGRRRHDKDWSKYDQCIAPYYLHIAFTYM